MPSSQSNNAEEVHAQKCPRCEKGQGIAPQHTFGYVRMQARSPDKADGRFSA